MTDFFFSGAPLQMVSSESVRASNSQGHRIKDFVAIFVGGTPIGAPLIGWVANAYGPRQAMLVGAASGIAAAAIGLAFHLRLRRAARPAAPEPEALPATGGFPLLRPRA